MNIFSITVFVFGIIFLLIALHHIQPAYPLAWLKNDRSGKIKSIRFDSKPNLIQLCIFLSVACWLAWLEVTHEIVVAEITEFDLKVFIFSVLFYICAMIASPLLVLSHLIHKHKKYLKDTLDQAAAELGFAINSFADLRSLSLKHLSFVLTKIEASGILEVSKFDDFTIDTHSSISHERWKVFLPIDETHGNSVGFNSQYDVRGPAGIKANSEKPMFDNPFSHLYPKYESHNKDTLACTWLYCLHNNVVMDKLIIKLRSNLVLDPNKTNVDFFMISVFWPVYLLKYLLVNFFALISVLSSCIGNMFNKYVEKHSV
jgi:hypothetical protein